jgi:hypothetical protein
VNQEQKKPVSMLKEMPVASSFIQKMNKSNVSTYNDFDEQDPKISKT